MSGPVSVFDPAILVRLRHALASLDDLERRRESALRKPTEPSSLAAIDAALPDGRYVTIYAGQSSSAAIDHLRAWRLLVNGPEIPVRAHLTLLRGALVDRSVDSRTRVGRGIATRRASRRATASRLSN